MQQCAALSMATRLRDHGGLWRPTGGDGGSQSAAGGRVARREGEKKNLEGDTKEEEEEEKEKEVGSAWACPFGSGDCRW